MPAISPEILVWARETAGLTRAEAARKIGLRSARGVDPAARLEAMEVGDALPTRAQVARMARTYRRPLVAFYLPAPPPRGDRGSDFRTSPEDAPREERAWLDVLIREVRARHALIRAALEEDEEVVPVEFVGRSRITDGVQTLTNRLIALLGFDRQEYRDSPSLTEAFAYLRERIEASGVFTLLIGDLGSHHTAISADTFRGYALSDRLAPFIVVNDRDARGAWSFTLIHEFCHVMLGETGVSAGFASIQVEQFCNDVASGVLLDEAELDDLDVSLAESTEIIARSVSDFARVRNLSRSLVAYRMFRAGRLAEQQWRLLTQHYREEWLAYRERERVRSRSSEGGPTYYIVRRHRLGRALLGTVNYLLKSGGVSVVKAAKILGVKPNNVQETLAVRGG